MKKDDGELYAEICIYFSKEAVLLDPISRGKEIFKSVIKQIRNKICSSSKIKRIYYEQADTSFLVASIFDVIAEVVAQNKIPVPPVAVSILACRSGLSNICKGHWNEEEKAANH